MFLISRLGPLRSIYLRVNSLNFKITHFIFRCPFFIQKCPCKQVCPSPSMLPTPLFLPLLLFLFFLTGPCYRMRHYITKCCVVSWSADSCPHNLNTIKLSHNWGDLLGYYDKLGRLVVAAIRICCITQ